MLKRPYIVTTSSQIEYSQPLLHCIL